MLLPVQYEIVHTSIYHYRQPVSFGEHRVMFRPRDSHDLRVLATDLQVGPTSLVRMIQDPHSNSVALVQPLESADELKIVCSFTIEHAHTNNLELPLSPSAEVFPFAYSLDERFDLEQYLRPHHDDPGGHRAVVGLDPAGPQPGDRRALVDLDTPRLGGPGQPGHQPRRLHPGRVRLPRRAPQAGHGDPPAGPVGVEQNDTRVAPAHLGRHHVLEAGPLRRVGGHGQLPAARHIGVDALGVDDPQHLVDGVVQRHLQRVCGGRAVGAHVPVAATGDRVRQPAAVAARGPVAHVALFHDDDAQVRRGAGQVVRRPQAGVARADDAHVGRRRAGQRGPLGPRHPVPPERHPQVVGLPYISPSGSCRNSIRAPSGSVV